MSHDEKYIYTGYTDKDTKGVSWYPSLVYGFSNLSFKSENILFSEGYVIDLEK